MVTAAKVLAALAQQGNRKLPRYQSERSGTVFARLTSADNLGMYKNRTLPIETRLQLALNFYRASNRIAKLYLSAFVKGEMLDSEMVEMCGALLRSTVVMYDLADEFFPTIQKDSPDYQSRLQDREAMNGDLANVVVGGLQTLRERESYRDTELARLVGHMQESVPLLFPRIPPGTRTEVLLRLEKMQDDPSMKALQPGLGELQAKVKASVEKGKAP